jgi:hypothetical protein
MTYTEEYSGQQVSDKIRHIWGGLSDEEIATHETMRDVFFLAVRKKYGIPRAQAEEMLRNMRHPDYEKAA